MPSTSERRWMHRYSDKPWNRPAMIRWLRAWTPRNTNWPRTWHDASARTGKPVFDLSRHQALGLTIIWPSRPSALSCWIAMSRRELAVSEERSGVSESGPPSPPALSNNAASLNSFTKLSAITSRENPHPLFSPQAREREPTTEHKPPMPSVSACGRCSANLPSSARPNWYGSARARRNALPRGRAAYRHHARGRPQKSMPIRKKNGARWTSWPDTLHRLNAPMALNRG